MAKENGDSEVAISITKSEPVLVHPVEEVGDKYYFLSNIDQNLAGIVKTVHLFKANEGRSSDDVGQVIKEALAKALVHFYPFAGRLTVSTEWKLIVKCDGRGVPFVEAVAECDMEELGDITTADSEKLGNLVYTDPKAKNIFDAPLLAVQVTRFKCGGFAIGVAANHGLADGRSFKEFITSWAEMVRGLPLSNPPFLDRTILRARHPPRPDFSYNLFDEIEDISNLTELYDSEPLQNRTFTFDAGKLGRLKLLATEDVSIEGCTSFEALTGFIWRARARALNMGPHQKTKLLFAVDVRTRLKPVLPVGYFGNGVILARCLCEAGELLDRPLSFAAELVRTAARRITDEFIRLMIDSQKPLLVRPTITATMFLSTWKHLDFGGWDFGWGEAVQFGPAELPDKDVVLFLPHGKETESTMVLLGLPAHSMEIFEEMMDF